jgi:hypothetical protein
LIQGGKDRKSLIDQAKLVRWLEDCSAIFWKIDVEMPATVSE